MSRLEELDAVNRLRALTPDEVDELWKLVTPSLTREAKRARYQKCKDVVNANRRWKWANDPAWKARKQANDKTWRERRKAR